MLVLNEKVRKIFVGKLFDMSNLYRLFLVFAFLFFSITAWANPAYASIQLNDQFRATQSCEAFQSLRRQTNPGNVRISPDTTYPIVAKNKADETFYHLRIEDAEPPLRWVSVECGSLLGESPIDDGDDERPPMPQNQTNILAISWQPAFCETHQDKTECASQTTSRFDAENFTLHGLWPKPLYCGVSDRIRELDKPATWLSLPDIDLSEALFRELAIKMPGVASGLHLHEWYKHGTCYSETPEEYYRESLALLDQVNNSDVQDLFADNIDRDITTNEIRDNFDDSFDDGAGERVSVKCQRDTGPTNRRMIQELKLNLDGDIEFSTPIAELFEDGRRVSPDCPRGEVDRVGFD